jgi:hypothetical protein
LPPLSEIKAKEPIVAMLQKRSPLPARKDESLEDETHEVWTNNQESEFTNIPSQILKTVGFIIDTVVVHQPVDEELEDHENVILISNITSALFESANFNNRTLTDHSVQPLSYKEITLDDRKFRNH